MNTTSSHPDLTTIQDVLMQQLGVPREQILPESTIMGDLGADSLDVVEIGMQLEERFDIAIPDENWDGVETVADLLETVKNFCTQATSPRR